VRTVPSFLTCLTFLWACSPSKKVEPVADWRRVPVSIELRLAEGSAGPELVPAVVHGQRKTVYLRPEPRLSNTDIARVAAIKSRIGQGLILEVWLTRAGGRRMAEMTGRHIGDSLAILINSVLISVPLIRDTLGPGTQHPFDIGVPLGPKEADQLARAVSQTWPSSPRKASK
jgi:preprotein translocase subunit SecD